MTKLTLQDLENAVNDDEKRLGSVGFSERDSFCATTQKRGNRIALAAANAKGFTYDQLVAWVDSKYGRWFWDSLYGCSDRAGAVALVNLDWMSSEDRALYGI